MKPTIIIPLRPGLEPAAPDEQRAPCMQDESIEGAVEAYLGAKEIEANAASLVKTAREELEKAMRNREAVETKQYRVIWRVIEKAGYWMKPSRPRPLSVFPKEVKSCSD